MPPVSMKHVEKLKWQVGTDEAPDVEVLPGFGQRFHHRGSESAPQLFEVKFGPNTVIPPHAHEHGEIIYILSGEMHFGRGVLKPGSSIFIQGETLYGFKSGGAGVHFLNFRPFFEKGHLTVDEINARKKRAGRLE